MRRARNFYDALQRYVSGVPDSDIPQELVEAMDELEAAWAKADDNNIPQNHNGKSYLNTPTAWQRT